MFSGELVIEDKNKAILEAKAGRGNLTLWFDGSNLDNGGTGAAVVWEKDGAKKEWQEQEAGLGLNKEIFDSEIWGISEAFKVSEHLKDGCLWSAVQRKAQKVFRCPLVTGD